VRSHGWSLDGIEGQQISTDQRENASEQAVFKASEGELSEFRARLERAVRELTATEDGIVNGIGEPLSDFRDVLAGVPSLDSRHERPGR
jgi:hypothetical protein